MSAGTLALTSLLLTLPGGRAPGSLAARPGRTRAAGCSAASVLERWSLRQLAEQTIALPVQETNVPAARSAAVAGYGGIVLFGTAAPASLGAQLAQLRAAVPGHRGLLVMTDEEGGGIQRMANLAGPMPWPAAMGATMSPAQIRALARSVAVRMARAGVTVDLAPVLDVDGRAVEPGSSDPDGYRSFSGSPAAVARDGMAFLQGIAAGGVLPIVKHFPGLGGASGNTDDGPASTLPWAAIQRSALGPFRAAIAAGARAVMVANAIVPGLTSVPASLSRTLVTGELRGALGFHGLVVADSLSARAITAPPLSLTVPKAAVLAIGAGDDLVLFASSGRSAADLALASRTSSALVAAVTSHRLARSQLVDAAGQVLAAKGVDLCGPRGTPWPGR